MSIFGFLKIPFNDLGSYCLKTCGSILYRGTKSLCRNFIDKISKMFSFLGKHSH